MTEDAGQNLDHKLDSDRATQIAQMQQLINEALAGGISELTMDDIRQLAHDQVMATAPTRNP